MKNFCILVMFLLLTGIADGVAGDFFVIEKVDYQKKAPSKGVFVYKQVSAPGKSGSPIKELQKIFIPSLEVKVKTQEQTTASTTFSKAYFYDSNKTLIDKVDKPTPINHGNGLVYATPIFFGKAVSETLYFALPEKVQKFSGEWIAVIVFGDQQSAATETFPTGKMVESYEFAEKPLFLKRNQRIDRKSAMDPVVEHVIKTNVPLQPQITLFLRPPIGMTDASQAKGVLAMCVIANRVEDIKRKLQGIEPGQELGGLLAFAEKNKLLILCWGSRGIRAPGSTWDELNKKTNDTEEKTFDELANKWAQGVDVVAKKYGFPTRNFLLWGSSDAGQYASRLVLRKPEYFLAVHCHIPNGFDEPRPVANKVLWCFTVGELDFCYERSIRFYTKAKELGYPFIYKAIIGLGHGDHPNADNLGHKFFEWALTLRDRRDAYDASLKDHLSLTRQNTPQLPWPEEIQNPPFYGDMVNQEMFSANKKEMIPLGFQVPLPTKEIADAWDKK